ncbi:hypothetical protein PQR02_34010 [Paraburkholderia sediminicola]|uniref:Uncharacterized protein n=1 Tax=Paraburkholderia rhynchosiae TaxID=487049 RepID=A0ACC7NKN2_9BURK
MFWLADDEGKTVAHAGGTRQLAANESSLLQLPQLQMSTGDDIADQNLYQLATRNKSNFQLLVIIETT